MDTNRQKVLQCIIDLTNARRPAARETIRQLLNEKFTVVDDAIKRLREDGLVRKIVPGIFEPVQQWGEDRPIIQIAMPDGRTKLEIGDDVLTLTPHEWQQIGLMSHGAAHQLSTWSEERRTGEAIVALQAQVRALEKSLREARRLSFGRRGHGQPDLFVEPDGPPRRRRGVN